MEKIVKVADIIPYENNPRNNDDAVPAVMESIKQCGYVAPIIVDENMVVLAGHTRLRAIKKLGYKEIAVLIKEGLTEEQKKKYRLLDNKTNEFAEWDIEKLTEELGSLDFGDFDFDWGLDEEKEPTAEMEEDDYETELPEEPKAKRGQIYQLGRHRLMCGDSTSRSDVEKLIGGAQIDLVFTDPPYGMKKEANGVANDNLNYDDLLEFNKKWIPLTFEMLKANGSWYCWGIDEPLMDIYSNILKPMKKRNEISIRNYITWDKESAQGQLSDLMRCYPPQAEKCWFVMKGVEGFNNNSDHYDDTFEPIRSYLAAEAEKVGLTGKKLREITNTQMFAHWFTKSQFTIIPEKHYKTLQAYYNGAAFNMPYSEMKNLFDADQHATLKEAAMAKRAYFDNTHEIMNDVWHFNRTAGEEKENAGGHATPKPLKLCGRAIKSSSREEENVLDVFGGSGSTLIACEQLNRNAFLMELEPKWADVIIARWENYTGLKAELVSD